MEQNLKDPAQKISLADALKNLQTPSQQPGRVYKIGELAKITQTTTRTLRFYEEMNLLQPIRNSAGQRLYSDASISRLNFINELKSGGFSLQEIKGFFDSWSENNTGGEASKAAINLIQKKLSEIADLQRRISKLNDELRAMVNYLEDCEGCDKIPQSENCSACERHQTAAHPLLMTILKKD